MKSLKTNIYLLATFFAALVFSKCQSNHQGVSDIPYNPDSAKVHYISVDSAAKFEAAFKSGKAALKRQLKDTDYMDKNFSLPISEKFNRDIFALLLNQTGAKGIRISLGKDKNGKVRLVMFPVDSAGKDIQAAGGGEVGQTCPPLCN